MRCRFALATTACLLLAGSMAQAQYGPTNTPSLLAVPASTSRGAVRRVAATRYRDAAPSSPAMALPPEAQSPEQSPEQSYGEGYAFSEIYGAPRQYGWTGYGDNCQPDNPWCEAPPPEDEDCGFFCAGGCGCGRQFLGYGCAPRCGWFGSLGGVAMTRDRGNQWWTTYETVNPPNQLMHSEQAAAGWRAGGEFSLGRYFCCGQKALTFNYWATDAFAATASYRDVNNGISTPIDLFNVTLGGNPAASIFDNAREHRIYRHNELHNLELNLWRYSLLGANPNLQMNLFTGARFFRFDETLRFSSVAGGFDFGTTGGVREGYLNIRDVNNLVGWQIGTRLNYFLTPRLAAYATPTFGLFGNQINQRVHLYRGDGQEGFDLHAQKIDCALMGAIDLGLTWNFAGNWSAYGGYRAVGFSGVALGDQQIPPFLIDAAAIQDIDSNGSLIVHGAMFGVQLNY